MGVKEIVYECDLCGVPSNKWDQYPCYSVDMPGLGLSVNTAKISSNLARYETHICCCCLKSLQGAEVDAPEPPEAD